MDKATRTIIVLRVRPRTSLRGDVTIVHSSRPLRRSLQRGPNTAAQLDDPDALFRENQCVSYLDKRYRCSRMAVQRLTFYPPTANPDFYTFVPNF